MFTKFHKCGSPSSGGPFVQHSAIMVEGIMWNISVKLF